MSISRVSNACTRSFAESSPPLSDPGETTMTDLEYKRWLCLGCGFLYDEATGSPEHGLAPGTRWADLPDDWCCPDCGTPKHLFEMIEIPYADHQPTRSEARA
jgi:rubredoxin